MLFNKKLERPSIASSMQNRQHVQKTVNSREGETEVGGRERGKEVGREGREE